MTREEYRYTNEFCNRYGHQVVRALKARAPVDTGSLRADVNFRVTFYAQGFNVRFYVDDHITPVNSVLLPSEYGHILDRHDYLDHTHGRSTRYWFSAPIPGLDQRYFMDGVAKAMARDVEEFVRKSVIGARKK